MDEEGGVGAAGIDFAVRGAGGVEEVGRSHIPLGLGNDVADLVVGQAEDKADAAGHEFAERWDFEGFDVEIAAGSAEDAAVDDLGIDFAGDAGERGVAQGDEGDFRSEMHPF